MNSLFQYFLLLTYLIRLIINKNCDMKIHNFFLLPLKKYNITENLVGLKKYDYMLILKPEPRSENENLHLALNISFPININIDLSNEIIYSFVSLEKFCLEDILKKDKGKYENLVGTLSEYTTENLVLERIWIKVENILFNEEISENRQEKNIFYLLTNYTGSITDINKKYILMKKMTKSILPQYLQIVSVNIKKEGQKLNNYFCENNPNNENELSIGNELITLNKDEKLRENNVYSIFSRGKNYILSNVHNFICLIYSGNKYEEEKY